MEICVADTGHGISPEDKDKLFLPHFSTKDRGTGLGLAIAARIVAEHGGTLHVEDNDPSARASWCYCPWPTPHPRWPANLELPDRKARDHSETPHSRCRRRGRHPRIALFNPDDEGYAVEAVPPPKPRLNEPRPRIWKSFSWTSGSPAWTASKPSPHAIVAAAARRDHDSGHGTIETAVRATKLGAFDFIEKPLSLQKINRSGPQRRSSSARLQEENQDACASELRHRYQVIGDSVPMKALRQQIAVTAPTNGRVLIYGESGTGKELVARALHVASLRSKGPFVEVNCAAIPEELIESRTVRPHQGQLHRRHENKIGKFQKADSGTLFLDEIGDMSLRTQAKVLRVLEEQRFEPVGASESVAVDVRVIAATNKNLEEEIARGEFPRGPVLSPQRNSLLRPAAARPARRHSHACRSFPERIQRGLRQEKSRTQRSRHGRAAALPLARQRPRTPQSGRAPGDICPQATHRAAPSSTRTFSRRRRKAPHQPYTPCTKPAAPTNGNSSCESCRNIAGT